MLRSYEENQILAPTHSGDRWHCLVCFSLCAEFPETESESQYHFLELTLAVILIFPAEYLLVPFIFLLSLGANRSPLVLASKMSSRRCSLGLRAQLSSVVIWIGLDRGIGLGSQFSIATWTEQSGLSLDYLQRIRVSCWPNKTSRWSTNSFS